MSGWSNLVARWRRAVDAFNYVEPEPLQPRSPVYTRRTVEGLEFLCDDDVYSVVLSWDVPNGYDMVEGYAFGVIRRMPRPAPQPPADAQLAPAPPETAP